jgi:peptidoglycan/LPS O-acetylase OafA/YrhL
VDLNLVTDADVAQAAPGPGVDAPAGAGQPLSSDDAFTKLIKLIPPIAVGTFLAVQNLTVNIDNGGTREFVLWLTLGLLLAGSYLYRRRRGVKRTSQLVATEFALLIYVFALGGPFAEAWNGYEPWVGSLALALGTFALVAWNPPAIPNQDE